MTYAMLICGNDDAWHDDTEESRAAAYRAIGG
jgi:hypothetical protein